MRWLAVCRSRSKWGENVFCGGKLSIAGIKCALWWKIVPGPNLPSHHTKANLQIHEIHKKYRPRAVNVRRKPIKNFDFFSKVCYNIYRKWERKSKKSSLWSPEATGSPLKGTEKTLTFFQKYAIIYIENERRDICKFRHLPCAAVIEEWIVLIAQTMLPKERRSNLLAHGSDGLQPAPTIRLETISARSPVITTASKIAAERWLGQRPDDWLILRRNEEKEFDFFWKVWYNIYREWERKCG